ncbi:hypothetical protein A2982_03610 [candidate division WWE3 bacterium RIFCSPLOWO2_01_FULL_39_13]|uniref:NYN domain-containing protein n=1 Tax=candidate division WWE3 bacterium RIFCSPLOWO2_01_FULL_39_13 TaxID=1802624 RepID=A0A1F4V2U4_UNCKA|nr:MAG: hypothetical protein A2982_03610 [candidate division WWE3 bacterium RIFCSPLOWO2_01_FULL_39_13]
MLHRPCFVVHFVRTLIGDRIYIVKKKSTTYAFIDASNIIYGTQNEGWKVDFKKLYKYLTERYKCSKIYYFAGLENKNTKQQKFYKLLSKIGYDLILKKVKIYIQPDGTKVRKANCDVDLTFYAMKDIDRFNRVLFLSGDGDFEILIRHFLFLKKGVFVLANSKRTAREIKQLKNIQFNDLGVLKGTLELDQQKRRRLRTSPPHVL